MKSIIVSIQPQWCELIASGKKTIEVRKSAPKEVPFKAYIYMTATKERCRFWEYITAYQNNKGDILNGSQKVIGEFICDKVYDLFPWGIGVGATDERGELVIPDVIRNGSCLTDDEICEYLNHRAGKAWHISELKIYDKPKELGEFGTVCKKDYDYNCGNCEHLRVEVWSYAPCDDCADVYCGVNNIKPLTRPPQSWQYVEEV